MKAIMATVFGVFMLVFSANAQVPLYEGLMEVTLSSGTNAADVQKFNLSVKNNNILVKPADKSLPRLLLNDATGVLYLLMDGQGQKMAIQLNLNSLNGIGGLSTFMGKSYGFSEKGTTIKATTETKTINGFKCTKYLAKDATYTTTVWITDEINLDFAGILGIDHQYPELKKKMIIKASGKDNKTGETFSFNVKPTPQKIDDAALKIPSGYQQMDMTNVIDQMMKNQKPDDIKKMIMGMMKH